MNKSGQSFHEGKLQTILGQVRYTSPMHTSQSAPLVQAHHELLEADAAYANLPSPANHLAVLRAQRVYYTLLRQHYRNAPPSEQPNLRRAQVMLKRAQLNLARRKDSDTWQEIALHQYRRARRVLNRARAKADIESHATERKQAPTQRTPRRKRVSHPITRRWVYVDVEED